MRPVCSLPLCTHLPQCPPHPLYLLLCPPAPLLHLPLQCLCLCPCLLPGLPVFIYPLQGHPLPLPPHPLDFLSALHLLPVCPCISQGLSQGTYLCPVCLVVPLQLHHLHPNVVHIPTCIPTICVVFGLCLCPLYLVMGPLHCPLLCLSGRHQLTLQLPHLPACCLSLCTCGPQGVSQSRYLPPIPLHLHVHALHSPLHVLLLPPQRLYGPHQPLHLRPHPLHLCPCPTCLLPRALHLPPGQICLSSGRIHLHLQVHVICTFHERVGLRGWCRGRGRAVGGWCAAAIIHLATDFRAQWKGRTIHAAV
eukprot:comp20878_c0_seq1/m.27706 comp20878_c0_seq1/g.27706  ORF comp20878_c0_seq1/g.27706 comp20878_c0_seq1/m.27706 type:complete len:306 (+) comp20878_c0_seq1:719-1636(+)